MRIANWLGFFAFAALLGASPNPAQAQGVVEARPCEYPGTDWCTGDPADFEFDPAGLQKAADYAKEIGSECLVVVRDGYLVYEWYKDTNVDRARNQLHDTWSVAKSFSSLAVAKAITDGHIKSSDANSSPFDRRVSDFVSDWAEGDGSRKDVTIAQVMSGLSGLNTDKYPEEYGPFPPQWVAHNANLAKDYAWVLFEGNQTDSAKKVKRDYDSGTKWKYNNRVIQILDEVLFKATGDDPETYLRKQIWTPLGMSPNTSWKRDRAGNPTMYSSVNATCRDLARVGHLVLKNGQWAGKTLIEPELFNEMLRRDEDKFPLQSENPAYGYLFWLNADLPGGFYRGNNNERFSRPRMFEAAPHHLVSMQGVGQNFVDILEDNRDVPGDGTIFVHVRKPALYNPFALMTDARRTEQRELLRRLFEADSRDDGSRDLPVPVVTPMASQILDVGRELQVRVTASYRGDGTEEIGLTAQNLPDGSNFVLTRSGNPVEGLFKWTPQSIGSADVQFTAQYQGRPSKTENLNLLACLRQGAFMNCGNNGIFAPPVINRIPSRSVAPFTQLSVQVTANLSSGPVFLTVEGPPTITGASFVQTSANPAQGVLRWRPTRTGTYTITFNATDAYGFRAKPQTLRVSVSTKRR